MNVVAEKGTKKRVNGEEIRVAITAATFGKAMDATSFLHRYLTMMGRGDGEGGLVHLLGPITPFFFFVVGFCALSDRLESRLLGIKQDLTLLANVKPYYKALQHEKDMGTRKGGKGGRQPPADRAGANQAESLTAEVRLDTRGSSQLLLNMCCSDFVAGGQEREAMRMWLWSRAELQRVEGCLKRKRQAVGRGWVRDWAWYQLMGSTGLRWCSMETVRTSVLPYLSLVGALLLTCTCIVCSWNGQTCRCTALITCRAGRSVADQ